MCSKGVFNLSFFFFVLAVNMKLSKNFTREEFMCYCRNKSEANRKLVVGMQKQINSIRGLGARS